MAIAATTEAMQILAGIKDTPAWLQMQDAMEQEEKAFWQQVLAVHTSTCAQRYKAPGKVESLEEAGLRYPLTNPGSGKIAVRLKIPALIGGHFDWDYTSEWHDSLRQAKKAACFPSRRKREAGKGARARAIFGASSKAIATIWA